jgi:hypothetical protein
VALSSPWEDYDGPFSLDDKMLRMTIETHDASRAIPVPPIGSSGCGRMVGKSVESEPLVTFVRVEKTKSAELK